jgi:hypothetical protein
MSENNLVRKAQTGEPTVNGGHFGSVARDEADIELAAAASYREHQADELDDRLARLGIDFDEVSTVSRNLGTTTIALREPHRRGGWDTVHDTDDGPLVYELHGNRHNTAGYAYEGRESLAGGTDTFEVWIRGEHTPNPDPDLHFDGQASNGDLSWSAGNFTVVKDGYGNTVWRRDGDLHRTGGPAIVNDDGEERWYLNDHEVREPLPEAPTVERHGSDDRGYSRHTGVNFREDLDTKTIASGVKDFVDHAKNMGYLPADAEYKVSHRTRDGHSTVTIAVEGGNAMVNPDWAEPGQAFYTPEGQKAYDALTRIGQSYARWEEGAASNPRLMNYQLYVQLKR